MNKNTLNTLKQLKVMNLRIVSFEQRGFKGCWERPKNFNLSTMWIMCEMECYANHRLEAWVAVLLESLLTMCSMSNGCSWKHELVVSRKKTRVKQTQKCNLSTLIIKKLCLRMKAKQLQQQPTRPDNECSWTEALSRKRKTWLRTVAFNRSLVASIVSWGFQGT